MNLSNQKASALILLFVGLLSLLGIVPYFGFKTTVKSMNEVLRNQTLFEHNVLALEQEFFQLEIFQKDYIFSKKDIYLNKITNIEKDFINHISNYEKITNENKLRSSYNSYLTAFSNLKGLILLEGKESKGLVGRLRKHIHILEKNIKGDIVAENHLLKIRRYEKDFLLRRKAKYIKKLSSEFNYLNKHLKPGNRIFLEEYHNVFFEIVQNSNDLDKSEQTWRDGGREIFIILNHSIDNFQNNIQKEIYILNSKSDFYLSMMILIAALNILGVIGLTLIFLQYSKGILNLNTKLGDQVNITQTFQDKLIASEKLASLGNVATGIAHEIKNPLNFIKVSSDSLLKFSNTKLPDYITKLKNGITDKDLEYLIEDIGDLKYLCNSISEGSSRADKIVKTMLEISSDSTEEDSLCDISLIIEQSLTTAINSSHIGIDNLKIFKEMKASSKVLGKKGELEKVFVSIVLNALYFLNKRLSTISFQPELNVSFTETKMDLRVSISNNGESIEHKNLSKIFEPFFTTKPPGDGVGLSLSISNDIIKKHNGFIEVNSNVNDITTFTVVLNKK